MYVHHDPHDHTFPLSPGSSDHPPAQPTHSPAQPAHPPAHPTHPPAQPTHPPTRSMYLFDIMRTWKGQRGWPSTIIQVKTCSELREGGRLGHGKIRGFGFASVSRIWLTQDWYFDIDLITNYNTNTSDLFESLWCFFLGLLCPDYGKPLKNPAGPASALSCMSCMSWLIIIIDWFTMIDWTCPIDTSKLPKWRWLRWPRCRSQTFV